MMGFSAEQPSGNLATFLRFQKYEYEDKGMKSCGFRWLKFYVKLPSELQG